jgi:hypothetical protein
MKSGDSWERAEVAAWLLGGIMIAKLLNTFFGCWHNNYSFPITVRGATRRSKAASLTGTYVVCLDCGKEFPYDWQEMKVVDPTTQASGRVASLATKEAA